MENNNNEIENEIKILPTPIEPASFTDLVLIVDNLNAAMFLEYESNKYLEAQKSQLEQIKLDEISKAYKQNPEFANGLKVAQIARKEQEVLSGSIAVKNALQHVSIAQDTQATAKRQRIYHENILSVTKAYLYSKSRIRK